MNFISVLTIVAPLLALAATAFQLVAVRRAAITAYEALAAAREPKVEEALRDTDLEGLGDYFFDTLGQLSLADYADDVEAREVVSRAVRNVGRFLRGDVDAVPETRGMASPALPRSAEADIAEGDLWGGLSRLRRTIEVELRRAARAVDVPTSGGAGQLLGRLQRVGVVDPSTYGILRKAIEICNRGVHGQDVSGEEAEVALALANEGLVALRRGLSGHGQS